MTSSLKAHALIIAVADYIHISGLPAVVRNDAAAIAAFLTDPSAGGYAPGTISICLDQIATLTRIRAEFDRLEKALAPDDSFLLYFSGHGYRTTVSGHEHSYLMLHDSNLTDTQYTALSDDELLDRLRRLPSERQVILIDACHAGGLGTLKAAGQTSGIAKAAIDKLGQGRGRVLLTSSRADETSLILPGATNSLFTAALLQGLRGNAIDRGDGAVGVLDLFSFIAEEVPRHADQHPVLKADALESNFAVALRPAGKAGKPVATAVTTLSSDRVADMAAILAELYPLGPTDSDIWRRAGGDLSRLSLAGHGRAQWHNALRQIAQGGGGLRWPPLLAAVQDDFPDNPSLGGASR